jgi:hypothetical protein
LIVKGVYPGKRVNSGVDGVEIKTTRKAGGALRRNPRGELGTRTATLHAEGIARLRAHWIYRA